MEKKQTRKLELNRETVRDLTSHELEHVDGAGNGFTKNSTCYSVTGDPCLKC